MLRVLRVVRTSMKNLMRGRQKRIKDREKNMRAFYKLNINENTDITSTPHKEEYDEQDYESVEEQKLTYYICILLACKFVFYMCFAKSFNRKCNSIMS